MMHRQWICEMFRVLSAVARDDASLARAFEIKQSEMPPKLYRYRSFSSMGWELTSLQDDQIALSRATAFNDPYDSSLAASNYSLFDMAVELVSQKANLPEEVRERISSEAFAVIREDEQRRQAEREAHSISETQRSTFVASFSEAEVSMLMWGHYANRHSGFCIEYEFPGTGSSALLWPVIYRRERLNPTPYMLHGLEGDPLKTNNLWGWLASLVKSPDWSYEREWRIIDQRYSEENDHPTVAVPRASLVLAGTMIKDADLAKLATLCSERGIPLSQMRLSDRDFSLLRGDPVVGG